LGGDVLAVVIPHFDLPFRRRGSSFVTVEQDSLRDIENCVEAALRTSLGEREGLLDFGITDPTFQRIPADSSTLQAEIERAEPRAIAVLEEHPDFFDTMIDRISIQIRQQETPNG
jgi:hypothetical protein